MLLNNLRTAKNETVLRFVRIRMRIIYLRTDLWSNMIAGGAVSHTAGVVCGMNALGHQVLLFAPECLYGVPGAVEQVTVRPWSWLLLPKIRAIAPLVYDLQLFLAALKHGRRFQPDLIYQRHGALSWAGAAIRRFLNCPLVLEVNSLFVRWASDEKIKWLLLLSPLVGFVERCVLRRADLVVAVSITLFKQVTAESLAQPNRIIVQPNAVDTDRFHPGIDASGLRKRLGLGQKCVIGYSGSFGLWQGLDVLLDAMLMVTARDECAHFLLIGDGPACAAVKAAVEEHGLLDRVTFTGLVEHNAIQEYLGVCDICVAPYKKPTSGQFIHSPIKLFEYMAMGKAIVASNLGQIGELLVNGETAVLVEPDDAEALAQGVLYLINNPGVRNAMGESLRAEVQQYTWRESVEKIISAIGTTSHQEVNDRELGPSSSGSVDPTCRERKLRS